MPRSRYGVLHNWSAEEVKTLVEFVLFNCTGNTWPAIKNMRYRDAAAEFVFHRADRSLKRTG